MTITVSMRLRPVVLLRTARVVTGLGNVRSHGGCRPAVAFVDRRRPTSSSSSPPSGVSVVAWYRKTKDMAKGILGIGGETPREVRERNDLLLTALSLTHRDVRIERQDDPEAEEEDRVDSEENGSSAGGARAPARSGGGWRRESDDESGALADEAAERLDGRLLDAADMSVRRLRKEVRAMLEPQLVHLLTAAREAEEAMLSRRRTNRSDDVDDDDGDEEDYTFGAEEEKEYGAVLRQEYEDARRKLAECDDRRRPFLETKRGALRAVLTYHGWWGTHDEAHDHDYNHDELDEFGFSPSDVDPEIVRGMRYYHARNSVRSYFVRNPSNTTRKEDDNGGGDDGGNGNSDGDGNGNGERRGNENNYERQRQGRRKPHSVLVLRSDIPSAGRGTFIDGFAPAGTLLAFVPGAVWPKEHLADLSAPKDVVRFSNDPRHQLSMRNDDVLVDSRRSPYTVVKNAFAVGHVANHPPRPGVVDANDRRDNNGGGDGGGVAAGGGPNCRTVPIDFVERLFENDMGGNGLLREYVPNDYERLPKPWGQDLLDEADPVVMRGIGIVATRDVEDEELMYDYRLSPSKVPNSGGGGNGGGDSGSGAVREASNGGYPPWYHVWDEDSIQDRWRT